MKSSLSIGEVARRAGVATSRIRYYESVGVLPDPLRVSGQRRYSPEVLRRLATIDVAQQVGFSLDEIRQLLHADGEPAHVVVRRLAERKLPEIDELIQRATAIRRWLEMTSACECDSIEVCSLFDPRLVGLHERAPAAPRARVVSFPGAVRPPS
ncbi:MAG TPA: MerR family transcriptional regulator [Thermoleophilaceae bacterium]